MTTTRRDFKTLRSRKSFNHIIQKMLELQNELCNICGCSLYRYEKHKYIYPKHLYEKGMPLFGKPDYEDIRFNAYEVDHIKPLSKGGTNTQSNYQLLCRPCNIKKGSKEC